MNLPPAIEYCGKKQVLVSYEGNRTPLDGAAVPDTHNISSLRAEAMGTPSTAHFVARAWRITGLRSKAFWSADDVDLPWVTDFERGFLDVKDELLALRGRGGFQARKQLYCGCHPFGPEGGGQFVQVGHGRGNIGLVHLV